MKNRLQDLEELHLGASQTLTLKCCWTEKLLQETGDRTDLLIAFLSLSLLPFAVTLLCVVFLSQDVL